MAGKYGLLTAAQGYLGHITTLVTERALRAETEADRVIDSELSAWSHETWSPTARPQEVALVWDLWAAATYLRLDFLASNPSASDESLSGITSMKAEAMAMIDRVKSRGALALPGGELQYPISGVLGASNIQGRLRR